MEIDPKKLPNVYDNATRRAGRRTRRSRTCCSSSGPGGPPGKPLDGRRRHPAVASTEPADRLRRAHQRARRRHARLLRPAHRRLRATGLDGRGKDLNQLLQRARADRATDRARSPRRSPPAARELKRLVANLAVLTKAAANKDAEIGQRRRRRQRDARGRREPGRRPAARRWTSCPARCRRSASSLDNAARLRRRARADARPPAAGDAEAARRAARRRPAAARRPSRSCATKLRPLVARARSRWPRDLAPATRRARRARRPTSSRAFQVAQLRRQLARLQPARAATRATCTGWPGSPTTPRPSARMQDAQGAVTRGLALFSCDSLPASPRSAPLLPAHRSPPSRSAPD